MTNDELEDPFTIIGWMVVCVLAFAILFGLAVFAFAVWGFFFA